MTQSEMFIVAWAIIVLAAIIVFGRWLDRYSLSNRKAHKQYRTNYQRMQARLATSSGTIQKGGK